MCPIPNHQTNPYLICYYDIKNLLLFIYILLYNLNEWKISFNNILLKKVIMGRNFLILNNPKIYNALNSEIEEAMINIVSA